MKFLLLFSFLISWSFGRADSASCRAQIPDRICIVNDMVTPRSACIGDSSQYIPIFLKVYDQLPPFLKPIFCRAYSIELFNSVQSTGASLIEGDGRYRVGVRKSILDQKISLSRLESWKEQLKFGASPQGFAASPIFPYYRIKFQKVIAFDSLYKIMIHEMGHVIDHQMNLTFSGVASWLNLSWKNYWEPLPQFNFPLRKYFCAYSCGSFRATLDGMRSGYEDLFERSNFINGYAASNAGDDFAESFAFYVLEKQAGLNIEIVIPQDSTYDLIRKMYSPQFQPKIEILERVVRELAN